MEETCDGKCIGCKCQELETDSNAPILNEHWPIEGDGWYSEYASIDEFSYPGFVDKPQYKYDEGRIISEIQAYIDKTYGQHYSQNKFQATEFIIDSGHAEGFCVGNIMKYAQRYGKKGTPEDWKKDLMKVIHYSIIMIYAHNQKYKEINNGN